jgi:pimeloyl-ACP methyl ester carboxylesterase
MPVLSNTYFIPWLLSILLHLPYNFYQSLTSKPKAPSPLPTTSCRYNLSPLTSILTLPSGRTLAYSTTGSPTGTPIFYIHGFPGSRLEANALDSIGHKLNARIIAFDRPGFGLSSMDPNRTMLSYADDLQALADHIGLSSYSVLGISGGGPYALACAHSLPATKLKAVTIVCGLGPPEYGYSGMRYPNRLGWGFSNRYFPSLTRRWIKGETYARTHISEEERWTRWKSDFLSSADERDLAIADDEDELRLSLASVREAVRGGVEGLVQDSTLMSSPFGFKIDDIRKDLPVRIWHGADDTNVPLQHARKTAEKLRHGNVRLRIEDETHATIWFGHKEEIMEDLLEAIREADSS